MSDSYELYADEQVAWLQTNRRFGALIPERSAEWQSNRAQAVSMIGRYCSAQTIARVSPGDTEFTDLDYVDRPMDRYFAEGLITTDRSIVLNANAADCGELAVYGCGDSGREVIALLHASRASVERQTYIKALDYMASIYDVVPESMRVTMSPSARAESYAFDDIDPVQKIADSWADYVCQDESGVWHVDFHQRTIDDLVSFGVLPESLSVSPIDTIANTDYFSHYRSQRTREERGSNGILFALRDND